MNCPKCQTELVQMHGWAYCPVCNENYSQADLELLAHEEAERLREELRDLMMEA